MPTAPNDGSFESWVASGGLATVQASTPAADPNAPGTANNPNVYLGRKPSTIAAPGAAGAAGVGRTGYGTGYAIGTGHINHVDDIQDFNTASASIYSWPAEQQAQLAKRLYNAGLVDDPSDMKNVAAIWADAVYQAGMQYTQSNGQTKLSPMQYLNSRIDYAVTGSGAVPKTTTSHNTVVQLPDRSDAEASVTSLFQESLGRNPTDDEMGRYVSSMMASYKKHPQTTTTTSTTDLKGNTTSKTSATGAYNPAQDLQESAEADPEWGAYQAATTYFNALQSALAAPAKLN